MRAYGWNSRARGDSTSRSESIVIEYNNNKLNGSWFVVPAAAVRWLTMMTNVFHRMGTVVIHVEKRGAEF